jgi:hypothetical protein
MFENPKSEITEKYIAGMFGQTEKQVGFLTHYKRKYYFYL